MELKHFIKNTIRECLTESKNNKAVLQRNDCEQKQTTFNRTTCYID